MATEDRSDHLPQPHLAQSTQSGRASRKTAGRPTDARVRAEVSGAARAGHGPKTGGKVAELPDGPADALGLSARQRRILEVIRESVEARGYPPSIREMGQAVGLASSSSVAHQLKTLEQKGFLRRDPNRPRALEVILPQHDTHHTAKPQWDEAADVTGINDVFPAAVNVPMLGRIAAGSPILAQEQVEDVFALPRQLVGEGAHFMLEVRGDSMIDAAICDGDWVVVRSQPSANNGDIVAALLDDEATVKTLRRSPGQVWLIPHNPAYEPIDGNYATIMGKVVAVIRRV